jgi:hypothetical protein
LERTSTWVNLGRESVLPDIQRVKVALPARFERATCGLGNRRSIHLSYGSKIRYLAKELARWRTEALRQKIDRLNTKAGKAARAFNIEHETLIQIIDDGMRKGLILENPAGVVIPTKTQFKTLPDALRKSDVHHHEVNDGKFRTDATVLHEHKRSRGTFAES